MNRAMELPWTFRLRDGIEFVEQDQGVALLAQAPLGTYRLNKAAADLLKNCDGRRRLDELLAKVEQSHWQRLLDFLETMASRGVLERIALVDDDWPENVTRVSVVVPVRDRPEEIADCLQSLMELDYPVGKLEVLVVDDCSVDPSTRTTVKNFRGTHPVRLIEVNPHLGQSGCRNVGVEQANSEIIAFTDSDCLVYRDWLKRLTPFFTDRRVAVVGGGVESHDSTRPLDRYENARSPLHMGDRLSEVGVGKAVPYIPTCNVLVRRSAFIQAGGFNRELHVGEDVDLIWRILAFNHQGWYVPEGKVRHRHRNRLYPFLKRRYQYATSEAILEKLHGKGEKKLPVPAWNIPIILILLLWIGFYHSSFTSAAVLLSSLGAILTAEMLHKQERLKGLGGSIPMGKLLRGILRSHLSFAGAATAFFSRYYLLVSLMAGLFHPPLTFAALAILALSAYFEYSIKKPANTFPVFLLYYALEMVAYQMGVWHGCIRLQTTVPLQVRVTVV